MTKPFRISIRRYVIIMIMLMTIAPLGIIINSTVNQLHHATSDAFTKTMEVAQNVAAHQQILISGADQLAVTLSKVPAIQKRDVVTANLILSRLIASNPQYANIAVIDTSGNVWASAVPPKKPVSVADKRYFRNVMATGKPASGEYNVSNVLKKPVLNFGFPLFQEGSTRVEGVIVVAFYLENYGSLISGTKSKTASILLADHNGTILYTANAPDIIGKQDRDDLLTRMTRGPDNGTFEAIGNTGVSRLFSYRKLTFKDETIPYMYVRTGLSKESILHEAHRNLLFHVIILTSSMFSLIALAMYISKRGLLDKVVTLREATRKLAGGNLDHRVAERVAGGELGELGAAFDDMARRLGETIREREHAAREMEAIIDTTSDGFIAMDMDGRIMKANNAYCALVGFTEKELTGMKVAELSVTENAEDSRNRIRTIVENGRNRFETRHRCKDGNTIGLEVSAIYLPHNGGRLYGFLRDTMERDMIQKELIKAQKMESISVLAGGIAHNFNNILTGVIGYISYAKKHVQDPEMTASALDSAEKASFKAAGLARQLLTFSRGGDPVRAPVSVQDLLRESVSLFLNGTKVKTVIECPSEFTVKVDREQIDQAFNNIVLNALQAMPEGGTLTVRVTGTSVDPDNVYGLSRGDYLKITFQDTGCGILEEDLIRVFDLYFTTKGTGSGLGLSTTQSIVKKHGGAIDIASRQGDGTTVTILLPASTEQAASDYLHPHRPAPDASAGKSVLVMDDQEMIRVLTARMLKGTGYVVDTCKDGEEAIACYRKAFDDGSPYATVIMDLTIPGGMGGTEAAQRILEFDPAAYLVVSSGYSDNPVLAQYQQYGFSAALLKPYNLDALTHILERHPEPQ